MELDSAFGFAESGPWKHRQTQVDGGGIQSVYGMVEFDTELVVQIQFACDVYK